jgi:hypothetical protein
MGIYARLGHLRRRIEDVARRALTPLGYQLTRRHFYSPIPIVEELPERLWDGPSELPGVDLRVEDALAFLEGPLRPHLDEFRPPLQPAVPGRSAWPVAPSESFTAPGGSSPPKDPGQFWLQNSSYESVDAEILYAMVRHLAPARVFELGSGASTHVIHLAALANARDGRGLEHAILDPFPYRSSTMGPVPGVVTYPVRAEDLDPARFGALEAGDVLFIDTTHTVRTGGDVTHIFGEILPRLTQGVTIHIHDIFLPYEYPRAWVVDDRRAWAEQYLLQAFLAFNDDFEVLLPAHALARAFPNALRRLIPSFDPRTTCPGAFWIRRRS